MTKDANKLVRQARRSLGLGGNGQQELIRRARKALGMTTSELAQALDKSADTVNAWLQSATTKKYRKMPYATRLLLQRILAEHRGRK